MRPFNGEDATNTFSSSLSSSSSSSSKTMEEVWKDINLSSLHHHSSRPGINLQDFLARPFAPPPPPPPPPLAAEPHPAPATVLNLNSLHLPHRVGSVSVGSFQAGFNANGLARKRFVDSDDNSGDRRHQRMIKNRESAARSRARKQESTAYTNQLEQEVSQLSEENSRLKKQLQKLRVAETAVPLLKKGPLSRTSTAPF